MSLVWSQQASPQQTIAQILSANGTVQNTVEMQHGGGRLYVGTHPYVWVRLAVNAGGVRLKLQWYIAETGGLAVGSNFIDTRTPALAQGPIAAMAAWVEVVTEVDATPRTLTSLSIWSAQTPNQESLPNGSNALLSMFQDPVPAFGTVTHNPIRVRWGWAHWTTVFDLPASYGIDLFAVDFLGATTQIGYRHSSVPVSEGLIMIPACPIRVRALNNAAGVAAFTDLLLFHPGPT